MQLPDLSRLTHEEKDALILALWTQVQALTEQVQTLVVRVAELEARLGTPPKTPDNSSLPPSKGQKRGSGSSGTETAFQSPLSCGSRSCGVRYRIT